MSRSSRQRREGWLYSQAYNSIKEPYDAAKTKPFSSPSLHKLAWDPQVTSMIDKQGKGQSASISSVLRSYLESKKRVYTAWKEASRLSFGVRLEHRLSLSLVNRIINSLRIAGDWETNHDLDDSDLEPVWCLSTQEYINYQSSNANKFMAAIEWIRALSSEDRISYEHCKILTMFLDMLPFSFDSGPIQQKNNLWKTKFERRNSTRATLGMGLGQTIIAYGYGWLIPRIDWEQLTFHPQILSDIGFSSSMLKDNYRKNWVQVKNTKVDLERIEAAGKWLAIYHSDPISKTFILQFIIIIIIQSYRKQIFTYLKPAIDPVYYIEAS